MSVLHISAHVASTLMQFCLVYCNHHGKSSELPKEHQEDVGYVCSQKKLIDIRSALGQRITSSNPWLAL